MLFSRKQTDPPDEASVPAISQAYPLRKKAQLIGAKACEFLLYIEPLWATGAAVFVYLSVLDIIGGSPWFGLIALALPFLARWALHGHLSRRTPFDLPIVLLLLAGLVGISASSDKSLSWGAYQSLLACVLCYYSLANYDRPRLLMTGGLFIAAIAVLVLGGYVFLQTPTSIPVFSQLQSWLHPGEPSSPLGWTRPPLAASACGATIAIEVVTMMTAGVALFPGRKITRIAAGIFTLLLLGVLTISPCRATWAVLAAGMIVLLGWRSKWLLLSLPAWVGVIFWSVSARIGLPLPQGMDAIKITLENRLHTWEGIWHVIAHHPLTGGGLGGYTLPYSHNAYLQFYSDFGLLGAVALIVAVVMFIRLASQMRNSPSNHPFLGITAGAWTAILVAAIYSLVESAPASILGMGVDRYYYAISPLFVVLGIALVVTHRALMGRSRSFEEAEKDPDEV